MNCFTGRFKFLIIFFLSIESLTAHNGYLNIIENTFASYLEELLRKNNGLNFKSDEMRTVNDFVGAILKIKEFQRFNRMKKPQMLFDQFQKFGPTWNWIMRKG